MAELYKEYHEELGSIYVPKTIAQILINVSMIDNFSRKELIMEFHIQALEEEIRRIDAFKRQLPHCIHFLEDAIEILKQEMLRWKRKEKCPVVEEFIPLKSGLEGCSRAKEPKDINEKKEWMSSVQLWTTPVQYDNSFDTRNQDSLLQRYSGYQGDQASGSGGSFKHNGGAFVPFKNASMKNRGVDPVSSSAAESEVAPIDLNGTEEDPQLQEPQPRLPQKKQRRCWSPELHRMFVDALQQLGGVESATPKQIREVMDVEGLTNDEVKSHLQKYRLHIRKLPAAARELNYSWLTRDNQHGGAPMPVVTYSDTSQNPNLHIAGGTVPRGSSDAGASMEREKDGKFEGHSRKMRLGKDHGKRHLT